jgi:hypothetical protein
LKKNEAPFNHPFHANVQEWMVVVVEDSWLPLLVNACLRAQVCSTQHRRCLPLYVGAQHLRGATLSCQDKVLGCHTLKFLILGCEYKILNKINGLNIYIKLVKVNLGFFVNQIQKSVVFQIF